MSLTRREFGVALLSLIPAGLLARFGKPWSPAPIQVYEPYDIITAHPPAEGPTFELTTEPYEPPGIVNGRLVYIAKCDPTPKVVRWSKPIGDFGKPDGTELAKIPAGARILSVDFYL